MSQGESADTYGESGSPVTQEVETVTFDEDGSMEHDRDDVSSDITTDGTGYYSVDTSSARTITIASDDEIDGREINIKRNGANNVDINTHDPSTTTIDDETSTPQYTLTSDNESVTLVYNVTNDDWEIY